VKKISVLLFLVCIHTLFSEGCSSSKPDPDGTIRGHVLLPEKIEMATLPEEAKVFIYLKDFTPKDGKEVPPWEAPVKKVIDLQIRALEHHRIPFEFKNLPKGLYGVSVLIDTGRPHVSPGSLNFTAFPGDYAGGLKSNVKLENNQTVEVYVEKGLYVTIPDGYDAPLYAGE
jgi:hypothetical protein